MPTWAPSDHSGLVLGGCIILTAFLDFQTIGRRGADIFVGDGMSDEVLGREVDLRKVGSMDIRFEKDHQDDPH